MGAEDQQIWLSGTQSKACPGMVSGNFEAAGRVSYALLLVPKSNAIAGYKVVVLSKRATEEAYEWKEVDHAEASGSSGIVISKVPPGKYSDSEDTKSVQLKLDGLLVEWMEKGAFLYYWSAGQYRRIQTSE